MDTKFEKTESTGDMKTNGDTKPVAVICGTCNHEHKEADGSCSCGCKVAQKL